MKIKISKKGTILGNFQPKVNAVYLRIDGVKPATFIVVEDLEAAAENAYYKAYRVNDSEKRIITLRAFSGIGKEISEYVRGMDYKSMKAYTPIRSADIVGKPKLKQTIIDAGNARPTSDRNPRRDAAWKQVGVVSDTVINHAKIGAKVYRTEGYWAHVYGEVR